MNIEINKKKAEYYGHSKVVTGMTGRNTVVRDVEPGGPVGYTVMPENKKATLQVYVAYENPLYEGLTPEEQRAVRQGIVVHEGLHQIFTPFNAENKKIKKYPQRERQIYAQLCNILEDPAIEYFADTVVGGHLLKSLRFAIAHTYKISPNIEEATSAFGQYVAALIQFGDMGPIKGYFTFPEAKKAFAESAELFNQGVEEPNGIKRLEIAAKLHEISRPLWEEELKNAEAFEELMKQISDMLAEMGKSDMTGDGDGKEADSETSSGESSKSKRRKVTIKKISKEEYDKLKKSSSSGGGDPSGDITIYTCDEADSDDSSKSGESISGESENKSDKDASEDNENSDSENGEKQNNNTGDSSETKQSDSDSKDNDFVGHHTGENNSPRKIDNLKTPEGFEGSDEPNEIGEIDEEEYALTEDDLEYIRKEAEDIEREYDLESMKNSADDDPLDDTPIESARLGRKTCLNYRVTYEGNNIESLEESYSTVLNKLNPGIRLLTTQLKKLFKDDYEEKLYRTSGKLNPKRLNSKKGTAKVFERRKGPVGRSDLVVGLLVDESGSMNWGGKYVSARECCIALSEVFANLNVPIYVMGFTADTKGHDIVHNHYITWKNSHADRLKLLNIDARCNNCDGYSIRYMKNIMKKKNAKHKLLIVLSDGEPAACNYYDGLADTTEAIRDARKEASVLGVAIGNNDTEKIFSMYGRDFLHVSEVNDLYNNLSQKVKELIKGWK